MKHTAIWAAIWGMAVLGGTETLVHRASAATDTRPASSARAGEGSSGTCSPTFAIRGRMGQRTTCGDAKVPTPKALGRPLRAKWSEGSTESRSASPASRGRQAHGETQSTASHRRVARVVSPEATKAPCLHEPVEFERGFGGELQPVVLTRCDGRAAEHAIEQLSVLVRPMNAPRPTGLTTPMRTWRDARVAPGGEADPRRAGGSHATGRRPLPGQEDHGGLRLSAESLGSFHQSARALDFHIEGVSNEALVAFCRTLPDTGCGYYPNSSFVHMDVRAPRTGHVYWIDRLGPGEPARYVASWPPDATTKSTEIPRPDPAAPLDEHTHPDSAPPLSPGGSDTKVDARTTAPLSAGDGKDDPFAP